MVWGGVFTDTLQLNLDTLWTGMPGDYTNPKAPAVLSKVRKLVDDGDYAAATKEAVGLSGTRPEAYQPLGDMNIEFAYSNDNAYTGYKREIDLTTATVNVNYTVGDINFTRVHFCSNPHQVLVTKFSANKTRCINFTIHLDSKLHHRSVVSRKNRIILEGSCPRKRSLPNADDYENPNGIKFSAILDIQIGNGQIQVFKENKLKVIGSDWAVLLIAASSSFEGPFKDPSDSEKDPTLLSFNILNVVKDATYSQLFAYHLNDYQKLFNRVSLQLSRDSASKFDGELMATSSNSGVQKNIIGGPEVYRGENSNLSTYASSTKSTAQRIQSFKDDEDPTLVELLFHYGRYLLISCSRPGTQAANLQGIWNKDLVPAWDAAPHFNINSQMNYWPSLTCNLRECQEPLFDYIASLAINGSKTAKVNYKTNGWVAHQVSDIWAKTSPDYGDAVWAMWPLGGAWLCTHLWEHYIFTMDKSFLRNRAYPILEGCTSFLLGWLIEGHNGYLETNPSTSPEHYFIAPDGKTASVSYSTTMDMAIIKEVFLATIASAEILGKTSSTLIGKIKVALPKLPPTRIARDKTIMEWAQDFRDPDVHHRHVSHLFGLFPGHTITIKKTPELCEAAKNSLYKRGDAGPGWSTTWKMALWAHLYNSEHAYKLVKQLFVLVDPGHENNTEGGLYSNLFTAHPPFQIDANFGFPAAIAEMLVQSTEHDLYLLPALPREKWTRGIVKGLKARGNVTAKIHWKKGKLHEAWFWSENQNLVRKLHYNGNVVTARISSGKIHKFNHQLKCFQIVPVEFGC